MVTIKRFEDIDAWKLARKLTRAIYSVSSKGGLARDFALRDQMRRSVISIPSNIAEGFERDGVQEFLQFLSIAKGSCGELRTQLYIALDQCYVTSDEFSDLQALCCEVSRVIDGLANYLKRSDFRGRKFT